MTSFSRKVSVFLVFFFIFVQKASTVKNSELKTLDQYVKQLTSILAHSNYMNVLYCSET